MGGDVLVTGASGFLGSSIIEELLQSTQVTVHALVRPGANCTGAQRLESLWADRPALAGALGRRVIPMEGDIERDGLGMSPADYDNLAKRVSVVFHTAAEVGVNQTRWRFWCVNVRGTANVLAFASHARDAGGLERFVHISTAYVAGRREGEITEELYPDGPFNSLYEWSKHEAELLVSAYDLPYVIVRPAQIVGDSRTGFITTFNTLYYPLKQYLKGRLRVIPASRDLRVNMVPVDYVARVACRAAADERAVGKVLHAVAPAGEAPLLGEVVAAVRIWAHENLHVQLPAPAYLPMGPLGAIGRARNLRQSSAPKARGPLRNLAVLAPYFQERRTFATARAQAVIGEPFPDWRACLENMLAFAVRHSFLNRTGRTVFEQMMFRLRSGASTRITYHDVSADGIVRHDGADVRAHIERIAQALMAHGVKPGARIATIGANSVRYFAVDAAIGLVGGVNVPMYYTSPVEDVCGLVKASGACMLIVGTDRMLDGLDAALLGVAVVSMADRRDVPEGVESWQAFLSSAPAQPALLPWVAPDQTATIRYTSGTTGVPKGVVFDQRQVRWMGEVMPAVLDWRTRNARTVRYLSFLPMSHVVEGILVAYAPYYILSDIEMFYLNDFPSLAEVLPKVRPNLFFSVPRFYEKVWNQFAATGAGRFWIGLPDGPAKRVLAFPLRRVVLRRAGLGRCRQLIVGSAPMGLDLMESYRKLGIEIHNAFGVTEAPLVTLSRLGQNELGSVGALLPETEARIDDEGIVHVRGPQVTRGYDGACEPAVDEQGWFDTGDLGSWSACGNLVLAGRKKEILVTSYGKNIAPQKIEVLLKGIDGVSEALVVADARPFTTALLWLEPDAQPQPDFAALDCAVRAVNERLSHPEQVKRWIVAARALSIDAGELTPNLKVRRNVVNITRAALVDALYDGWGSEPDDMLHRGEAS